MIIVTSAAALVNQLLRHKERQLIQSGEYEMTYHTEKASHRLSMVMVDALALLAGMAISLPFFLVICLPFFTGF